MSDIIVDFLDWFSDFWDNWRGAVWKAIKILAAVGIIILTIPLWLIAFVAWFFFIRKGGEAGD